MSDPLKPVSEVYLRAERRIGPGHRLHRLISRIADTYYDDVSDDRLEELERIVDGWRWMNASGERI